MIAGLGVSRSAWAGRRTWRVSVSARLCCDLTAVHPGGNAWALFLDSPEGNVCVLLERWQVRQILSQVRDLWKVEP